MKFEPWNLSKTYFGRFLLEWVYIEMNVREIGSKRGSNGSFKGVREIQGSLSQFRAA